MDWAKMVRELGSCPACGQGNVWEITELAPTYHPYDERELVVGFVCGHVMKERVRSDSARTVLEQLVDALAEARRKMPSSPSPAEVVPSAESMVPDVAEALIGWRWFRVVDDRGRDVVRFGPRLEQPFLGSIHVRTKWGPGTPLVAVCKSRDILGAPPQGRGFCFRSSRNGNVVVPGEGCVCGIYALRERDELLRRSIAPSSGPVVLGEVLQWGKVRVGEKGRRSQFAYPKRLFVVEREVGWPGVEPAKNIAGMLGRAYGVPVSTVPEADVMLNPLAIMRQQMIAAAQTVERFQRQQRRGTRRV